MHTVFALLCFVVVIHWLIFPYPSALLHWHCGNLTIAPVPAKQPWWKWINTSCEFIMNDCITTTKQSTTKPCAYFFGYTVCVTGAYQSTTFRLIHVVANVSSQGWINEYSELMLPLTHWDRDKMAADFLTFYKCIFLNENIQILITISLKFVPNGVINIPALVQIMALSE